jgi:predicted nucleic acid-binding protein
MNFTRRVVFDTSTLVSAALHTDSPADRALVLALREGVICASEATFEYLHLILTSRKWDRYMTKRARLTFVDLIRATAWYCVVSLADELAVRPAIRDKRTKALLALAATAEADVIVAIAPDLLARKSWRRIPIVTPSKFASWYDPA